MTALPRTNPDCIADRHGTAKAAKEHGCGCQGALENLEKAKRRSAARRRKTRNQAKPPPTPRKVVVPLHTTHHACRDEDPELFFPVGISGPARAQAAQAKAVCARCPVRAGCLETALTLPPRDQWGITGGLTADERCELLRRKRAAA